MKATIVECVMGVLGFGEEKELLDQVLFPKDVEEIADRLREIQNGKVIQEVASLIDKLESEGYNQFIFENSELARNAHRELSVQTDVEQPSQAGELLRRNLEEFAVDLGFVEEGATLHHWIHKVSIQLTKRRVKRAMEKRDLMVTQAIQTIDDLDKTLNLFMGRIREWYGLHFPELDRLLNKHETYARLITHLGRRENFNPHNLMEEEVPEDRAEKIAKAAQKSMGAALSEEDVEQIEALSRNILGFYDTRRSLETYIDSVMEAVAPNTRAIAGSLLGARLIALAGGLMKMAKMPSSTVQVLGAEKALFRALKKGSRPPKHGIIFQHNLIQKAKPWQRGKVARGLAGKISIAARVDAFGGKYRGDRLQEELESRMKEIQEKYARPASKR